MDKINIEVLYPSTTKRTYSTKEISLDTLCPTKQSETFNVDELIRTRKQRRNTLLAEYTKSYERCLDKIKIANSLNKIEICFDVPRIIMGCHGYRSEDCIDYIQQKLRVQGIDTLELNKNSIYISWLYLELNRDMAKRLATE
jgi:hypothetical protein